MPRHGSCRPGTVYFIRDEASGLIKIGFTQQSIWERVAQMRNANPGVLTVLGVMRSTSMFERNLLHRFSASLKSHEWFYPSDDLVDYVRRRSRKPPKKPTPGCPDCYVEAGLRVPGVRLWNVSSSSRGTTPRA